jgi:hypothetical protein
VQFSGTAEYQVDIFEAGGVLGVTAINSDLSEG